MFYTNVILFEINFLGLSSCFTKVYTDSINFELIESMILCYADREIAYLCRENGSVVSVVQCVRLGSKSREIGVLSEQVVVQVICGD
jgi:hypothetical protein